MRGHDEHHHGSGMGGLGDLSRARLSEARAEEVLQLALTVQQDLRELAEGAPGDSPAMASALACNAAAVSLVQSLVASRREDIALLTGDLEGVGGTPESMPVWSLSDAWLMVDADARVLAASDDACIALSRPRDELLDEDLTAISGIDPAPIARRLGEAARMGISVVDTDIELAGWPRRIKVAVHRLPGRRFGGLTFLVVAAGTSRHGATLTGLGVPVASPADGRS